MIDNIAIQVEEAAERTKESNKKTRRLGKLTNLPGSEDGIPMEPLLKNMSEESKRFFEKIEEIKENIDTVRTIHLTFL